GVQILGEICTCPSGCSRKGGSRSGVKRVEEECRRLHSSTTRDITEENGMTTREEHLAWCKQRALEYVEHGDLQGALTSMGSDLTKVSGGQIHDPTSLSFLIAEAVMFRQTPDAVRNWINGFN